VYGSFLIKGRIMSRMMVAFPMRSAAMSWSAQLCCWWVNWSFSRRRQVLLQQQQRQQYVYAKCTHAHEPTNQEGTRSRRFACLFLEMVTVHFSGLVLRWTIPVMFSYSLCVLDHRSLPPVFEYRRGHIWKLFHLWLRFITFGGRSVHLAYQVHKSGRKRSIISY